MAEYETVVYHVGDLTGSPASDQLNIPLTRLHCNAVTEVDKKTAAAEAWIQAVGRFRQEKLEALNAPQAVKDIESSRSFVTGCLKEFPIELNSEFAFVFNNGVEAWLISVDKTATA